MLSENIIACDTLQQLIEIFHGVSGRKEPTLKMRYFSISVANLESTIKSLSFLEVDVRLAC